MSNKIEIRLSDITAPRLIEEQKINVGQSTKMLAEYESKEFESFILEWLKYCKYKGESNVRFYNIGGTGDEGIDILIDRNGSIEIVQCKRHLSSLTLPQCRQIITKILWYLYDSNDNLPSKIFVSSLRGINGTAAKAIVNINKFKKDSINNIKNDLNSMRIPFKKEAISGFKTYLDSFDFSKIEFTNIDAVIQDYFRSDMASFRFSNKKVVVERQIPEDAKLENKKYIQVLEDLLKGETEKTIDDIVGKANEQYYCALQLEATCEYLFCDTNEFDKIKNDIEVSVNNELLKSFDNNKSKISSVLDKAINADISDSYLSYGLHIVNNVDKCGTCHILTNEDRVNWYD